MPVAHKRSFTQSVPPLPRDVFDPEPSGGPFKDRRLPRRKIADFRPTVMPPLPVAGVQQFRIRDQPVRIVADKEPEALLPRGV